MKAENIYLTVCIIIIIALCSMFIFKNKHIQQTSDQQQSQTSTSTSQNNRLRVIFAVFSCDNNKYISAGFYRNDTPMPVQPGQPPVPNGIVDISVNGAASTTLNQTLSADGARYANADESFVFWNKGNTALIMRNNSMDMDYTNCATQ